MYTSISMYRDVHNNYYMRVFGGENVHNLHYTTEKLNNCHDNYPINLVSQRGVQRIMIISRQKGPVGCGEVRLSHNGRGGRGTKINGERERERERERVN